MVSDDDAVNSPFVVAINETLARKFFAGKDPLGQRIDVGGAKTGMVKPYTIVGIIGDQVDKSVSAPPQPWIMFPYQQIPTTSLFYQALLKTIVNFVVKTRNDMPVAPAVRTVFRETAPDYALDNFQTMQQAVDQSNFSQRLGLYLTGAFAGMAVLMVVAGLYGVLAQLVSYRKREFGIRLALGATPQGILRMVLRQGLVFVGAGLAVGIVAALFAGKLVTSFLYGVKPSDVWTYAGVVSSLAARREPGRVFAGAARFLGGTDGSAPRRIKVRRRARRSRGSARQGQVRFRRSLQRSARMRDRAPETRRPLRSIPWSGSRYARCAPPGLGSWPCW